MINLSKVKCSDLYSVLYVVKKISKRICFTLEYIVVFLWKKWIFNTIVSPHSQLNGSFSSFNSTDIFTPQPPPLLTSLLNTLSHLWNLIHCIILFRYSLGSTVQIQTEIKHYVSNLSSCLNSCPFLIKTESIEAF